MNSECRSNSLHITPRSEEPKKILSPTEYAAAGDNLRGQISPDLNLVTSTTILAMDTKRNFNRPYVHPNVHQVWSYSNEPLENVASMTDKDSPSVTCMSSARLVKNSDDKSRSASKPRIIEHDSDCHISDSTESPCKEYSHNTPRASNYENFAIDERTTLVHSEMTKANAMNGGSVDLRNTNEGYSVEEILSPDRKISMFSAEIWTEKILPIDTFVSPEPELVEIYFDNHGRKDRFNRFGDCSMEASEMSAAHTGCNLGMLGENIPISPRVSDGKSKPLSSGQKTINFDDEIWPVCPKLIPSGKELSILTLENRYEAISPEKLNENGEELAAIARLQCNPLKGSSIFGVSSRSSTKQYNVEDSSRIEKVIEPTHEIEGQIDFESTSEAKKTFDNNSRPALSRASITALRQLQRFNAPDRICPPSPNMNILGHTGNDHFLDNLPKSEPSIAPNTCQQLNKVDSNQHGMRKNFTIYESCQTRNFNENLLSISNSEPVSTVFGDIPNQRTNNTLYEAKTPVSTRINCDAIMSVNKIKIKRGREDCGSSFDPCPPTTTIEQISFAPIKKNQVDNKNFENTFPTPTDVICAVSREMIELPRSSTLNSNQKMCEQNVELDSRNQESCPKIHAIESYVRPLISTPSCKLLPTEFMNAQGSISKQEIKRNPKCVKVVRFKMCGKQGGAIINRTGTRQTENSFDNTSDTPDSTSVESFKQEIDQMAEQIARQLKIDPALDDAVETLAKIELIVEANRRTAEKLQQLQPHVAIPQLTPPDAGKSLAKALMRCRKYMQNSEYSPDATHIINKLLTSTVQSLRQSVEKQKLVLAAQEKRCTAPGGRRRSKRSNQEHSLNVKRLFTADEFAVNQVQCLIADILKLTEKIVPKLDAKETQREALIAPNYSDNNAKNFTKNIRMSVDTARAKTNNNSPAETSKISLEAHASKATHLLGVPETVKSALEKPMAVSKASSNLRTCSDQKNLPLRGHQRTDKELESIQSLISPSTYPKKITSTEPTKTLKKLFNELWEKRSKTLSRHSNVNDGTHNFRSLASNQNATINQKLPVWKPGGNNFVQSSVNVSQNNHKVRTVPSSSTNKKKNTTSEHTRDTKGHQRAKTISGPIKDASKISEKSIVKPNNTTSLAKIRSVTRKGPQCEVVSLDRSKVQVAVEVSESRARKPRSKSRTRTRTPNKISRTAVTRIPLEHTEECSTVVEQTTPFVKDLLLSKKPSSSPKDIIQMLEELIKCSGNGTPIHNASPVHIVAQCNVAVEDIHKDIDQSTPLKIEVRSTSENNFTSSHEQGDHGAEESSQNQSNKLKSVEEIVENFKNIAEINDDEILIGDEKPCLQDTITKSCNLHVEVDTISAINAEEIFTVSRSNSEACSNRSMNGRSIPSVSNVSCTAKLSSENSVNSSVSSKCCQASLSSLTSHEISEGLISGQISDTGAASCCGETRKDSDESFDTVEDEEVTRHNFSQQFQKDESSASTNSSATPRRKFFNKHARSLELLKEILSEQGLGIHLLSRAENELRDKCKCSSNKRGLNARRSLQGTNFVTSNISGGTINRISMPERNLSTSLFSKLATLSESESNLEHVEVATMTTANDSTLTTNDYSTSDKLDYHCRKEDKALLSKVITVENATQFDITAKSDMCVGDGIICDISSTVALENQEIHKDNFEALYTLPAIIRSLSLTREELVSDETKSFDCKLPSEILDAFKLAAIRAANLYAAVSMLRENVPFENIIQSNLRVKTDSNEILKHVPTTRPLSVFDESLPKDDGVESGHERNVSKAFSTCNGIKSQEQLLKANTISPVRIIVPRTSTKVNDEAICKESANSNDPESRKRKFTGRNMTTVKESDGKITNYKMWNEPDNVNLCESFAPPKSFLKKNKAFGTTMEKKKDVKERSIDLPPVFTLETKFHRTSQIPRRDVFVQKKGGQSPISSQQNLTKRSITEKRIETLHFAGRQTASAVKSTLDITSEDIISEITECRPGSLNANFVSYEAPKFEGKIQEALVGSRIKTLLQENLQRFKTDYNPMLDGQFVKDYRDQLSTDNESSDDQVLTNKVFDKTIISTSCTHLDDYNIILEVKNVVNYLLNKIEANSESSTMTEHRDLNIYLSRHRRLRKPVRRLNPDRTKKVVKYGHGSILCVKYRSILDRIIVSREHVLSIIYAAICSFVFCCLQFSLHCEV